MSTEKSPSTQHSVSPASQRRDAQEQQWRDIGIASVAAAAHQTSEKHAAEVKAANEAKRPVTLRDLDFFAA